MTELVAAHSKGPDLQDEHMDLYLYKLTSAESISSVLICTFVEKKKWLDDYTVWTIAMLAGVMDTKPTQACTTASTS